MKAGVVVFPGTNCDRDTLEACEAFGWDTEYIWHFETDLKIFDIIFLPGGFSYGDYIASGRLAKFSPVVAAIKNFIKEKRGFVVGICNGFQILCESGLLPGALTYNEGTKFICKNIELALSPFFTSPLVTLSNNRKQYERYDKNKRVSRHAELVSASIQQTKSERFRNEFGMTQDVKIETIILPIAHAEGQYVADEKTIDYLKKEDMIFLTYIDNPNGSVENIAGLYDRKQRIIGMMPHPERAFFKETAGGVDGKKIFQIIQDELTLD